MGRVRDRIVCEIIGYVQTFTDLQKKGATMNRPLPRQKGPLTTRDP
jgi:hypothetical protein